MAEAHQAALTRLDRLDERGNLVERADLTEHPHDRLVGSAVQRSVEGRRGARRRGVRVGAARPDNAHRRGAAVLLVVGVEDEQHVHRPREHGIDLVVADLPHHVQEVRRVRQVVVGLVEGEPDREAMAHGGDRRGLRDEPQDLTLPGSGIADVLGALVEGAECGERRDEHAHRVGVVVEAVDEALAHVLVDERVMGDVEPPLVELRAVGQVAVEQEIGDLEVRRPLGELLDRVAAVAEHAVGAVEVGDRRLRGRGREVRGVVAVEIGIEFAQGRRGEHTTSDRCGDGLAGAVVGDGDGLGHVASSRGANFRRCGRGIHPRPGVHVSCRPVTGRNQPVRVACCRACGARGIRACPRAW